MEPIPTPLETPMKTLLVIRSSLFLEGGQSNRLAERFVQAWRGRNPGARVIVRDVASEPVPHLTAERFGAFLAKPEARTPAQQAVAAYSDALIAELQAADEIVLGLPLYNLGLPSTLKAYFDHVARAGITFRYTATGPEGLLRGKRATVLATRGGAYAGTPLDTATDSVRNFLAFLGITDTTFVYAERLSMGEEPKAQALAAAEARIAALDARNEEKLAA